MEIEKAGKLIFLFMLLWSGWQDFTTRSISQRSLMAFGSFGIFFCLLERRTMEQVILSCAVGVILLGIGKLTAGAIGDGDGWFFIVSGFYLSASKNILLFLGGLACCFFIGLVWIVYGRILGSRQKKRLPFLSILVPTGVWILMI